VLDFPFHERESGSFPLSRPEKTRHLVDRYAVDPGRRNFLIRCCQGASAALLPTSLRDSIFPFLPPGETRVLPPDGEFHLHPHYRSPTPLDATLLKARAGFDDFITEKYAEQIAAILAEWSATLLRSPQDTTAIEKVLTAGFFGASLQALESRLLRPGPVVEAHQSKFSSDRVLRSSLFLQDLRLYLEGFSKLLTAEF